MSRVLINLTPWADDPTWVEVDDGPSVPVSRVVSFTPVPDAVGYQIKKVDDGPTDGVPPMSRDQIHAALGECPDCYELGHICRPCRAKRYEARNPADEYGVRAALVVVYYALGILAVAVAFFVAVIRD